MAWARCPAELVELIDRELTSIADATCLRCVVRGLPFPAVPSTWSRRLRAFSEAPLPQRRFLGQSYFMDRPPAPVRGILGRKGTGKTTLALQWASELYISGRITSIVWYSSLSNASTSYILKCGLPIVRFHAVSQELTRHCLYVFDDFIPQASDHSMLISITAYARHIGSFVIATTTYLREWPVVLRKQFDYVVNLEGRHLLRTGHCRLLFWGKPLTKNDDPQNH